MDNYYRVDEDVFASTAGNGTASCGISTGNFQQLRRLQQPTGLTVTNDGLLIAGHLNGPLIAGRPRRMSMPTIMPLIVKGKVVGHIDKESALVSWRDSGITGDYVYLQYNVVEDDSFLLDYDYKYCLLGGN